jgi:organic radical activating enzyme
MYAISEIFYSLQGEGVRAGTPNVFVRFAGCNLTCMVETHGFDCDTEFSHGLNYSVNELLAVMNELMTERKACILTGGEPSLQVDECLIKALKADGWYVAIETNGTKELPSGFDWVTVSPKSAAHTLKQLQADEVKYVIAQNMALPKSPVKAASYLISPSFAVDGGVHSSDLRWCLEMVKKHPQWRLSMQQHKIWGVR